MCVSACGVCATSAETVALRLGSPTCILFQLLGGGAGPVRLCPWSLGEALPLLESGSRFLSLDPCVHSSIWASLWLLLTLAWAVTGRGSLS